jgi:cytochrome c oxidase assembly factor CtaG
MDVSVTAVGRLLTAWDWEPSILIGCAALVAGYCFATRCRIVAKALSFFAGVLLLALSLMSPLDRLGDEYLLSAHIAQHFLLALVVAPLLLLGIPARELTKTMSRWPLLWRLEHYLGNPAVSWPVGVGAMLIWHVPALFNAALTSEGLHIFQHLSLLVSGTVYWWPVVSPHLYYPRLSVAGSIVYLFTACVSCSLLGAILTFSPPGLYPAYLHPADSLGILPLVRERWGLDPAKDQQLGGLLMWVPGCFVYLSAILWTFAHWYGAPEYTPPEYTVDEKAEAEILLS